MDVAGRANYWPNQVQLNDERLTLGLAAVVLLGWAFVALAIAFGAVAVRGRAPCSQGMPTPRFVR